ncbi:PEP-CTERM sorting domain-containing protein [uncultured Desulfobacter sp.]|uniref:PEP-CTERM sorting domain-containing protein n=1 Tax=uncultured Desulfobacter sp. TaxID=240139 RepID=UPI0029F50BA7|nr:PEP-CTERM sorting domain-containing protein [uncultured Desulfobacter sp.]
MKILKLLLASVVLCFVMATNGFSYTITINGETTDVGSEDTFLKSDSMSGNSGDATETAWVNGYLASISETVKYVVREETVTIYKVGGTDSLYAVPMSDTDSDNDYFLVKNATYVALFENNADFDWGVFDASDLPERMNIKEGSITVSHVTEFVSNGGTIDVDPVPEPSTFLLFGAGLLGLAKLSRRKK